MGRWDYGTDGESSSRLNSVRMADNTNSRTVDWLYHNSDEESYQESSIESDGTNDEYINKYKTYPRCYSRRESVNSKLSSTLPGVNSGRTETARISRMSMSSSRRSANTMYLHFPRTSSRVGSRMVSLIKSNKSKWKCGKRDKVYKPDKPKKIKGKTSPKCRLFKTILLLVIVILGIVLSALYFSGNASHVIHESKFKPIPGLFDPRILLGKNRIRTIQVII